MVVKGRTRSQHHVGVRRRREDAILLSTASKLLHAGPPHYADYNLLQKVQDGMNPLRGPLPKRRLESGAQPWPSPRYGLSITRSKINRGIEKATQRLQRNIKHQANVADLGASEVLQHRY